MGRSNEERTGCANVNRGRLCLFVGSLDVSVDFRHLEFPALSIDGPKSGKVQARGSIKPKKRLRKGYAVSAKKLKTWS